MPTAGRLPVRTMRTKRTAHAAVCEGSLRLRPPEHDRPKCRVWIVLPIGARSRSVAVMWRWRWGPAALSQAEVSRCQDERIRVLAEAGVCNSAFTSATCGPSAINSPGANAKPPGVEGETTSGDVSCRSHGPPAGRQAWPGQGSSGRSGVDHALAGGLSSSALIASSCRWTNRRSYARSKPCSSTYSQTS